MDVDQDHVYTVQWRNIAGDIMNGGRRPYYDEDGRSGRFYVCCDNRNFGDYWAGIPRRHRDEYSVIDEYCAPSARGGPCHFSKEGYWDLRHGRTIQGSPHSYTGSDGRTHSGLYDEGVPEASELNDIHELWGRYDQAHAAKTLEGDPYGC